MHLHAEQLVRHFDPMWANLRANYLYVFEDLEWAQTYWALRGPRQFYELSIDPADVLRRCDMEIFNRITEAPMLEKAQYVDQYCTGVLSPSQQKIELIVCRGTVRRIIGTAAEQNVARDEWLGRQSS